MFQIDCRDFRDHISGKHSKIADLEIEIIAKRSKIAAQEITDKFKDIHEKINRKPDDIESLTAIKEFMDKCDSELDKLQGEIAECMKIYEILDEFQYKFDEDDIKKKHGMQKSPKDTIDLIERQTLYLEKEKEKLINQMFGDQNNFKAEITQLETTISTLSQYNDINQHQEVAEIVRNTHEKMKKATEKAKKFTNRERLMGLNETDYTNLQYLTKEYDPYYNLWTTTDDWFQNHRSWLNDPWSELDAVDMEEKVSTYIKNANKVNRFFKEKELTSILEIGESIKDVLSQFKPFVPIAIALRKDGMKDRHWEALSEKVGFHVHPTEDFNFQMLIDMNLVDHVAACEDIGERAAKEYTIEVELQKMKDEWHDIEFFMIPFKKSGTYTVTGFDDALNCLDEQNVKTQAMQFSPFKKPFEDEIKEWYDLLLLMTDALEEWIKCQGQWAYLQPIFDSPDIMKQLPAENKKFKSVDGKWRNTMKRVKENPNVLTICEDPQLKDDFVECNEDLDIVQKGLKDYLESKRAIFARFYFLSNDDLLLILSQTKDVQNVRPHLRKVFENLHDVNFKPDNTISSMYSAEGE
jgi:dynein heavy chain